MTVENFNTLRGSQEACAGKKLLNHLEDALESTGNDITSTISTLDHSPSAGLPAAARVDTIVTEPDRPDLAHPPWMLWGITVPYHGDMSTSAVPRLTGDAVLIPVKAFDRAKLRLASALTPLERRRLAKEMAERVVRSAAKLTVAVVCDDEEVAAWASGLGAVVLWEPGRGLNGAVQFGFEHLRSQGVATVAVVASDLPLADDIGWVTRFRGITLVPDRREDGTNVISVPPGVAFRFSYGPQSFMRHKSEALRANAALRVVHDSPLAWDVDVPDDLGVLTR